MSVPRLMREVLYAPNCPPPVATLFEVALTHHNSHNFVDSVNVYMQALAMWEDILCSEAEVEQGIVVPPKSALEEHRRKKAMAADAERRRVAGTVDDKASDEGSTLVVDGDGGDRAGQDARNQLLYAKPDLVPIEGRIFVRLAVGSVFDSCCNDQQALAEFGAALQLVLTIPIFQTNVLTATVYACLGCVYSHLAQHDFAADYFFRALEIREQCLTANHVDVASVINNIGVTLHHLSRRSDALIMFNKARGILATQLAASHPKVDLVEGNVRIAKATFLTDAKFPPVPFVPFAPSMIPGALKARKFYMPKAKKPAAKDDKKGKK